MSDASSPPPPQPTVQQTFAAYSGPPLDTIRSIVSTQFQVRDAFLDPNGVPTFLVDADATKDKFMHLVEQLRPEGLIAAIRGTADTLTIKVFQKPQVKQSRRTINLGLFLATVVSVTVAGYFLWTGGLGPQTLQAQYNEIILPGASPYLEAGVFAAGLLAIIGLHEFGHKAATVVHGLDASFPYFIPGPPPIGTFGALISLKGPPTNRDQLFDLGLSGPVVGFIVTMVVGTISMLFGPALTPAKLSQLTTWDSTCSTYLQVTSCFSNVSFPAQPLILVLLSNLTGYINPNVIYDQQLFFAAQIGALLTFLNIVPAWQLDGGHISRAVFGPGGHRIATVIGLGLLLISGFWAFAILVLVMMSFTRRGFAGVEPLDDVSPVSNSRKILYLVGIAMLVLTFARSPI
ncbi:site-2 protease family protein [Candidatus Bathyarchaeota archaeon]|nr:MAG: site-2 protease family protein [Candidatus Bathyarchaeota archaeon]